MRIILISVVSLFILSFLSAPASAVTPLINRIEGRVYSADRTPLGDINIELLNEFDAMLGRTRSGSDGRFTFTVSNSGNYKIKALPLGTNLAEQTQTIEVGMTTRGNTDIAFVEFYLQMRKTSANAQDSTPSEAVFLQDISPAAKELYTDGMKLLKSNETEGIAKLEAAIKELPTYYDALIRLGQYYVDKGSFDKALPYLAKAVEVNSRSFTGNYLSAYSLYKMNQIPAAVTSAKAAVTIKSNDYTSGVLYGTVLRLNGNFKDAETVLLKAKAIDKGAKPDVHWQLSLTYNRLSKNKEAADELEEYLKLTPGNPDEKKIRDTIDRLRGKPKT